MRQTLPRQRGASEHTCYSYAYAFQLLFQFASARLRITPSALCLEQLDARLIMDFFHHLETERQNSPRTRSARLVAIKSFMRLIEHRVPSSLEQSRRILAIPAKRTDTRLIRYLSLDEMQALLNAPDLQRRYGIRDRAMLHLCFSAGLRAWLAVRGQPPVAELFVNARDQPMTRSGFEYILKKHVQTAAERYPSLEQKRISPHTLRHYLASRTM